MGGIIGGTIPHPRAPRGIPSGSANKGSCGAPLAAASAAAAMAPGSNLLALCCWNRCCRALNIRSTALAWEEAGSEVTGGGEVDDSGGEGNVDDARSLLAGWAEPGCTDAMRIARAHPTRISVAEGARITRHLREFPCLGTTGVWPFPASPWIRLPRSTGSENTYCREF